MTIEIDGDKLDENTLFSLRENHTVRVSTLLTPDEFTWSRDEAEGRGVRKAHISESSSVRIAARSR